MLIIANVLLYGEKPAKDLEIKDGIITAIYDHKPGKHKKKTAIQQASDAHSDSNLVDGGGKVLLPGLVDIHVHFREPGREDAETLASGSQSAAAGGFTAVCAMPNTNPVADNAVITDFMYAKARDIGLCDVQPIGAVTVGQKGEKLAELGSMAQGLAQVRMFSDDGVCVHDPLIMRRALEYTRDIGGVVAQHCEEHRLTSKAVAHEGAVAARLGLPGWPRSAEEIVVARDALLARDSNTRVHMCHMSTSGSAAIIKFAKEQGIAITAEVTPHHLLLTDSLLVDYNPVFKVAPPLREQRDVEALRQALCEGVLDCVATDHAPHAAQDKACSFAHARPGMLGLETSLAIISSLFVKTSELSWRRVAQIMSETPAQIAKLTDHGRPLTVGEPANLTLVDPDLSWTVKTGELHSISDNTPYAQMQFTGKPVATFLRGKLTYTENKSYEQVTL